MKLSYVFPLGATAAAVSVSVPSAVPTGASPAIDKQFLGLGIEAWAFVNFTGSHASPNNFSLNMFKALSSRTGALPIRLGGSSGDRVLYVPTQTEPVLINGKSTEAASNTFDLTSFGPSYFDGLSLVENAKWVYQAPLLRNNLSNAVAYMQAALNAMPNGTFQAIEIGNEPTQYGTLAPKEFGTWNEQAYVNAWLNWTATFAQKITNLPKGKANFWTLSLPTLASWSIPGAFADGLNKSENTIQAVSEHSYESNTTKGVGALQESLLNHTATVKYMSAIAPITNYLNGNTSPVVPFILGEVGPGMCATSPCSSDIAASFGVGLWVVDYMLHAMTLGVQRVNMQMVGGSYGAAWRPVPFNINGKRTDPVVQGIFYGEVLIADLLSGAKSTLRVAELPVSPSTPTLVAYAAYDGGAPSKLVLLNEALWLSNSTGARPVTNVTLSGLPSTVKTVTVQHLTGTYVDKNENISWAGQQWTYANNGIPSTVRNDTTKLNVAGYSVTVPVEASQGVVVTLNS